jgi:colanic acid/amylovoran biosynthesis protein
VIFSLTSGVPCIAIEYEHKTRGIMRDLGLEEWVLPIADVTHTRLWCMVQRLVARRAEYLDVIRQRVPDYTAQAERLPELLKDAVGPRMGRPGANRVGVDS